MDFFPDILHQDLFYRVIRLINSGWFLWLPLILIIIFWKSWLHYIRTLYINSLSWVLLEIKIPREIQKTPYAMEVALTSFHITKKGNLVDRYWRGVLKPWMGLEVLGAGGKIRFFIYVQKKLRNLIESQIYSQYPGAEIIEADDYTSAIPADIPNQDWQAWGAEFGLNKESFYPIKTYVDFGLQKPGEKEEEKVDPITTFLEMLGHLKQGEFIWFQILIRAASKEWRKPGEKFVEKLVSTEKSAKEGEMKLGMFRLSPGQQDTLKAVERKIAKLGFKTGIRAMYLARRDAFEPVNISALTGVIKQYNAENLNGFKVARDTGRNYFFVERREAFLQRRMLNAYRKRSWFYMPYRREPYIMTAEELATIYHFPGRVAEIPTFARIEAKKAGPPSTLPT